MSDIKTNHFVKVILVWWENNRKDLPWRRTKNPYFLLVTEILLRKTTSKQVDNIYHKFFQKYPSVYDLRSADQKELENILFTLGMEKKRSKELLKISEIIVEDFKGIIPHKYEDLIKLPGVGRYTANGVICQAYKNDKAMVDTNVIRVVVRYFNFKSSKKRLRDDVNIWAFMESMIPLNKCKEFNLGLIDFASSVCTSKKPKCSKCDLNEFCSFFINQMN
ncbi:MAG: hypothetical protein ACP5C3_07280 [Methanomicrobiales archaeon]